MTYFYKVPYNGKYAFEERCFPSSVGEEITEEEYNAGVAEIEARIALRAERIHAAQEQSKDERIEELERENAALLFELLTGEEYTDYE
ncbi:MAG: hypothetical protein IJK23_12300 [Clostridia bacterium]|nr:hypothetical protein [Clostridia bacterium]